MSHRNSRQQGDKVPLDGRSGLGGFPPLRGVKKSKNPASIADNQFAHLLNVRIKKGILRERGGLVKGASNAFPGVQGIHDASDIGAPSGIANYVVPLGSAIFQVSMAPVSGNWFSWALDGAATTRVTLPTNGLAPFARPFLALGKLIIGTLKSTGPVSTDLYKWDAINGLELALTVPAYPNSTSLDGIYSGCEFDGNFYYAIFYQENLLGLPMPHHMLIYQWDGVNAPVLEEDQIFTWTYGGGFNAFSDVGTFNTWALYSDGSDVFAICKGTGGAEGNCPTLGNLVKKRNGGSWDTITLPGGYNFFGASFQSPGVSYGGLAVYDGATYIAGIDLNAVAPNATIKKLKILRVDGAGLTEVWTRTNSNVNGSINLFVADGVLYFNYSDSAAAVYRMGSFDGTTWTDTVKTWSAAPQSLTSIPNNVVEYAGEFWFSLYSGLGGMMKTVSRDVTGLWEETTGDVDNGAWLDALN